MCRAISQEGSWTQGRRRQQCDVEAASREQTGRTSLADSSGICSPACESRRASHGALDAATPFSKAAERLWKASPRPTERLAVNCENMSQ